MRPNFLERVGKGSGISTREQHSGIVVGACGGNCRGGVGAAELRGSLALQGIAADQGRGGCRGGRIGKISGSPCAARDTLGRVVPPPRDTYRRRWIGNGVEAPPPNFLYTNFGVPDPYRAEVILPESLVLQGIAS